MRAALALARRGLGSVWPNPAVGCVVVNNGMVVGRGWTQSGGRPHAETEALTRAGGLARLLDDENPNVRIATAEILGKSSDEAIRDRALAVLLTELAADGEWRRLAAANAIDNVGAAARGVRDEIEAARKDQPQYVTRVLDALSKKLND